MRRRMGARLIGTAALVWLTACAARPQPFEGSPSRGQMLSHFDLALEARDLAILGEVEEFRHVVDDLDRLAPARDLPAEVILQLGPMRWEAREAARARTTEEAATGAARIALTCGQCHQANEVGLGDRFTLGGPPPPGSAARHMAGLAWASRLMWDGLIGPSDRTWFTGAEGLVELGTLPEGMGRAVDPNEVDEATERLRTLGRQATDIRTAEERAEILGDVWATCAGCHVGPR